MLNWKHKDLLGIENLTCMEIDHILNTAEKYTDPLSEKNWDKPLLGKTVINLFYEPSTRTRTSFELAAKRLGADVANMEVATSSVKKGETLIDTVQTIDAMDIDCIVVRHGMSGTAGLIARNVKASVVNAGDGLHEHPTQALLDLFTMRHYKKDLSKLKVAIIGDIMHSRVARSNIIALTKYGADVTVAAPPTLLPQGIEVLGANVTTDAHEAAKDADVIMGLRIQKERQDSGLFPSLGEYSKRYCINEKLLRAAKPDAIIMHPGPVNRGVEITSDILDSERSVVLEQVRNGVAIRMAILNILVKGGLRFETVAQERMVG